MKNKPQEALLPSSVSEYVFDPLVSCLLKSTEEELLQIATEAFSYMIHNSSKDVITPKWKQLLIYWTDYYRQTYQTQLQ